VQDADSDEAVTVTVQFGEDLDSSAYFRFGFVHDPTTAVPSQSVQLNWGNIHMYLGNVWRASCTEPNKQVQQSMLSFFGHFTCANTLTDVPSKLYDLLQDGFWIYHNANICVGWPDGI